MDQVAASEPVEVVTVLPSARDVDHHGRRLHVVDLAALLESGVLGPAAAALTSRWLERQ